MGHKMDPFVLGGWIVVHPMGGNYIAARLIPRGNSCEITAKNKNIYLFHGPGVGRFINLPPKSMFLNIKWYVFWFSRVGLLWAILYVDPCMFWCVWMCLGLLWCVLVCFGVSWFALVCFGVLWCVFLCFVSLFFVFFWKMGDLYCGPGAILRPTLYVLKSYSVK